MRPGFQTSREISGPRSIQRFLDSAGNDKAQQVTRPLFADLAIHHGERLLSAALNMAVDEALLETATIPTIRFYGWRSPALSFGYFGEFSDVAIHVNERDLVRRWTGGGIVFHGDDLTYSIVIPASDPVFSESSIGLYEKIHRALVEALSGIGGCVELLRSTRPDWSPQRGVPTNNCFANPVRADVMIDGRKIAGAAQRRTRRGLLQQGSIQGFIADTDLAQKFARALSVNCSEFEVNEQIFCRAQTLAQQKYGTESWQQKR